MNTRILSLFMIAVLLMMVNTGCAVKESEKSHLSEPKVYDTAMYTITVKDGQYTLTPKDPTDTQALLDGRLSLMYPKFASVAEMKQAIITGSYLEGDKAKFYLSALTAASQKPDKSIEICNLDKLYECVMPSGLSLSYVTWHGADYLCGFSG